MSYPTIVNAYLEEKLNKEAEGPRLWNPLRPSSAGNCTRKLAYERMEYKGLAKYDADPITPDLHRVFKLGHAVERNVIYDLEDIEVFSVKYKQQVVELMKVDGEIYEGSLDMCIFMKNSKGVGDVKSKNDRFFKPWETKWDLYNQKLLASPSVKQIDEFGFYVDDLPAFIAELKDKEQFNDPWFADNFEQLNVYANSQFLKDRGVNHAFILQYNKNDSRLREIRFKPSELVFEQTKLKFETVINAVDRHQNPDLAPRDYEKDSLRCKYCPYKKMCWAKTKGAKK